MSYQATQQVDRFEQAIVLLTGVCGLAVIAMLLQVMAGAV